MNTSNNEPRERHSCGYIRQRTVRTGVFLISTIVHLAITVFVYQLFMEHGFSILAKPMTPAQLTLQIATLFVSLPVTALFTIAGLFHLIVVVVNSCVFGYLCTVLYKRCVGALIRAPSNRAQKPSSYPTAS